MSAPLTILRPGLLTTVQDLGRAGHQHMGVPAGGAMDDVALRLANLLVGNDPGLAALETTLQGPALRFEGETVIAVTGADQSPTLDGKPLPPWRAVRVRAGGELAFGAPRSGCRAYLAVAGGIDVPRVLGARATYLPARIGGLEGRALRAGDELAIGETPVRSRTRGLHVDVVPRYEGTLRLVPSGQFASLQPNARTRFLHEEFRVERRSDRMGVRMEGPVLGFREPMELLSGGVAHGTVQLPPDGQPIVLAADRQTTGGYPRLGEVCTVDLPSLAQLRPGDTVRFTTIAPEEARRLYLERERRIAALSLALRSTR